MLPLRRLLCWAALASVLPWASRSSSQLVSVSNRKRSLVIVDNFLDDPDALRAFALRQRFQYKGSHPGQRTISFANDIAFRPIRRAVERLVGMNLPYWFAAFQRTLGNDSTALIHRDYPAYRYSAMLYLTPNAHPRYGTSTWRHRETGLYGYPTADYCLARNTSVDVAHRVLLHDVDEQHYEKIDRLGNVYNRLLIFDSRANHRSTQREGFGSGLEDSRLFLIAFFNTEDSLGQKGSLLFRDDSDATFAESSAGAKRPRPVLSCGGWRLRLDEPFSGQVFRSQGGLDNTEVNCSGHFSAPPPGFNPAELIPQVQLCMTVDERMLGCSSLGRLRSEEDFAFVLQSVPLGAHFLHFQLRGSGSRECPPELAETEALFFVGD